MRSSVPVQSQRRPAGRGASQEAQKTTQNARLPTERTAVMEKGGLSYVPGQGLGGATASCGRRAARDGGLGPHLTAHDQPLLHNVPDKGGGRVCASRLNVGRRGCVMSASLSSVSTHVWRWQRGLGDGTRRAYVSVPTPLAVWPVETECLWRNGGDRRRARPSALALMMGGGVVMALRGPQKVAALKGLHHVLGLWRGVRAWALAVKGLYKGPPLWRESSTALVSNCRRRGAWR